MRLHLAMNPTRLRALAAPLAFATALGIGVPVVAQDFTAPPPVLHPLTLAQAIELALSGNEISGIAAVRLEGAAALRRQAIAQFLPALNLTANATRRAREVTRIINGDEVTVQAIDAYSSQAVVDTPLFDLRALPLIRAATRGLEAQTIESEELRRALAFDVADGFYAALSLERLLEAAHQRVAVGRQTVEESRIRLEAGLANRNDLTRTELELATAELVATRAANTVTTARLALFYLINAPPELTFGALDVPTRSTPQSADRQVLVDQALAGRQELIALDERSRQARQLALAPRLGWVPRLDLRGVYRWTNEAGLSGNSEDWNIGANLTWELFDGGDRIALAAQRDAVATEAELDAGPAPASGGAGGRSRLSRPWHRRSRARPGPHSAGLRRSERRRGPRALPERPRDRARADRRPGFGLRVRGRGGAAGLRPRCRRPGAPTGARWLARRQRESRRDHLFTPTRFIAALAPQEAP